MICGSCSNADPLVYCEECDCCGVDNTIKASEGEIDIEELRKLLEAPITPIPTATYAVRCLICGSEIPVGLCENHAKVCDDCKKAIMFIKEHFRYED